MAGTVQMLAKQKHIETAGSAARNKITQGIGFAPIVGPHSQAHCIVVIARMLANRQHGENETRHVRKGKR